MEVRKVTAREENQFSLRSVADEIWIPIDGDVDIILVDRRPRSPTEDASFRVSLEAEEKHGLLIPFGVAFMISTETKARLLRLSTHRDDSHEGDQLISAKTLSHLLTEL